MTVGDGRKRGFVGGILRLVAGFPGFRVQLQFVEQHFSHLSGGGDVELGFAGEFPDAGLAFHEFLPEPVGKNMELGKVHLDPVAFHPGQHFGQGLFHFVVEVRQVLAQFVSEGYQDGGPGEVRGIVFLRGFVKEGAGHGRGRCFLQRHAQIGLRQGGELVAALGVEHVVHEFDVVPLPFQPDSFRRQLPRNFLEVDAVLGDAFVLQEVLRFVRGDSSHLFACGQQQAGAACRQPYFPAAFDYRTKLLKRYLGNG